MDPFPPILRGARLLAAALVLALSGAAGLRAEEDAALTPPPAAEVERALAALKDAPAEDAAAARLRETYSATLESLAAAAQSRADRERHERLYADAPARQARYTAELQSLQRAGARQTPSNLGVRALNRRLEQAKASVAELRAEEAALSATLSSLQTRVDASRQELKALGEPSQARAAPAPVPGESVEATRARRDAWAAAQDARAALRAKLETEIRTLPARLAAVQAESKLVLARREQAERELAELSGMENLRRIAEASRLREESAARLASLQTPVPELRALALEVDGLAAEHLDAVTRYESGNADLAAATRELEALRASFASTSQQLEVSALREALGPVLVAHHERLQALEQPEKRIAELGAELSTTRLREFRLGQQRDAGAALGARLETALAGASEADALLGERMLAERERLLEAMSRLYVELTAQVMERDRTYQEQAGIAASFRRLLDRNLVWMRSHEPLRLQDLAGWPAATLRLLMAQDWAGLGTELGTALRGSPVGLLAGALALLLLWRFRAALKARLGALGLRANGFEAYRFHMALQALGVHLLLALPLPLVFLLVGWLVQGSDPANPLAAALGGTARDIGLLAYGYLFVLQCFGADGFARQHLRWKTARVQSVERWMRGALRVLLPLAFFARLVSELPGGGERDTEARIAGLLLATVFFVFASVLVREGRGMFGGAFFARRYALAGRVASVLLLAVLAIQPFTVLLDVLGYHFTASALLYRGFLTLVVMVVAKLVLDTGLLGLAIAGQRSREAQADEAAAEEGAETGMDLERMNASALALLHVFVIGAALAVLATLWAQFVTALSILDTVELWQYQGVVDGREAAVPVSLFDLLGALLLAGLALVLARGLPALLGVVLYSVVTQKGLLFAIQSVISYVLVGAGVILALQMLGFGWSKLQWMAAGLSVGLGFGLQEIFANFFAGLIMLFERPVRIGDVVTLGEFSGTIQRIRMRATTITDFDNREIIVPNKMFVTERLINWTLSSSVVRLSFDVGVSYVSDPRKVREILLSVMAEDPRVLRDPEPSVVFREFGPSSLNFRCFAHVEDLAVRFPVQNDLHTRITEVFRENGIEIAYPQMDLHVRSVDGTALPHRRAEGGGA